MTESWRMKSSYSSNQLFACVFKDGARLYFVEKRNKLHYLRGKITGEMVINNHVKQEPQKALPAMSEDKDSNDDDMPEIEEKPWR